MYRCQYQVKRGQKEAVRAVKKKGMGKNILTNTNDRVDGRQRRAFVKR